MGSREAKSVASGAIENADETPVDVAAILDNVVSLDRILDEASREQLGAMPYLELSKHLKIKKVD